MANTFSSIYLHLVFAVKFRDGKIIPVYRERIYQYIKQILRHRGHIPVAIGGTDNHLHVLFSYNINESIPDLVREVKTETTKFINRELLLPSRFEWQRGYGVFSHSARELDQITNYIQHQPEHHLNMSFTDELKTMLRRFGIPFEDQYLPADV